MTIASRTERNEADALQSAPGARASNPRAAARFFESVHTFYKTALSPIFHAAGIVPGGCRFQPTCSEYATLALAHHGPIRGLWLTIKRLLRCHPLARGGWDPVPRLPASANLSPSGQACASPAIDFAPKRYPASPQGAPAGTIEMPHPINDP